MSYDEAPNEYPRLPPKRASAVMLCPRFSESQWAECAVRRIPSTARRSVVSPRSPRKFGPIIIGRPSTRLYALPDVSVRPFLSPRLRQNDLISKVESVLTVSGAWAWVARDTATNAAPATMRQTIRAPVTESPLMQWLRQTGRCQDVSCVYKDSGDPSAAAAQPRRCCHVRHRSRAESSVARNRPGPPQGWDSRFHLMLGSFPSSRMPRR